MPGTEIHRDLASRACWLTLPSFRDARGNLIPFEFLELPFQPVRAYTVADVPCRQQRGEYGHRMTRQIFACVSGRIRTELRRGSVVQSIDLSSDGSALLVEPGVWCRMTYIEPGSVLLVLADQPYSRDDYFTDPEICP